MKKYHIFLSVFAVAVFSIVLNSCSYLDEQPDNLLTEDQIWETKANAEAYLYNIYSYVHQGDGGDWASVGGCDESSVTLGGVNVRQMVSGNWSAGSWYFWYWATYYNAIRKTFVFEQNIDKVPAALLGDELKAQYKAENIFLRGWFFWQILKQYGPYIKITDSPGQSENFNLYPRTPFDTCVAHINALMDQAAATLPSMWASSSNVGRPTKGSCLAVKSQATLWAASPLWNGNPAFANFTNLDGTPLAAKSFDNEKWKTAALAAKEVIDLNVHRLFTNQDQGDPTFNPYLSVRNLFITNWNDEILFANNTWSQWGWTKCVSPSPGGYNIYNATQNLVDQFYMSNGKTIDDATSGYQETGFAPADGDKNWEHKRGDWNMYVGREPRFYAFVSYNGRPVLPAPTIDDRNYYSSGSNANGSGRSEFYYTGKSGQKAAGSGNVTGYGILKRVSPNDNIRYDAVSYRPYIHIRYAEILLNYVEALNEYEPGHPDILTYLNAVRTRAGLPNLENVYPEVVGNQEKMREFIIRERLLELCFEGDRYYTLNRRLLAGKEEHQTIYGMNTNADDEGQGFAFTDFYKRTLFQKRYWSDKMYLFPIQQTDIETDRAMVQNPGW